MHKQQKKLICQSDKGCQNSNSFDRYAILFQTLNLGVVFTDAYGTVTDANPAACDLLGLTLDQMKDQFIASLKVITVLEDGSEVTEKTHPAMMALKTGCEVNDVVIGIHCPHKDKFRWLNTKAVPILGIDEKKSIQIITIFEDITEQKLAMLKLKQSCDGLEKITRKTIAECSAANEALNMEISEHIQSENRLREYEAQHNSVLQTINEGIIVQMASGEILIWNKAAEEITGIKASEALWQTSESREWPTIRLDGSKYEGFDHPSMRTLRTGHPCMNEIMGFIRPSGDVRWISINTSPLFDSDGTDPYGVIITFSDITEKKNIETALHHNEAHLKLALKSAKAGTWEWNLETGDAIWSDELYLLFEYDPQTTKPSQSLWLQSIHPDDRDRIIKTVDAAVADRMPMTLEWRLNSTNGILRWLLGRGEPLFDSYGCIRKYIGVAIDITDHKMAEISIAQSEACYRELFNNSRSGVAIYNAIDGGKDFIIKDFNRAGEKMDGNLKEDVVGRSICDVWPGIKNFGLLDVFRRVWETGDPEIHPESLYQDDRLCRWFENFVYRLPSGEIVAVFEDVTERKRAEEELKERENHFRRIFYNNMVPMGVWFKDGTIVEANEALLKLIGYTQKDIEKGLAKWTEMTPPEYHELELKANIEVSQSGYCKPYEKEYRHKDGHLIPILIGGGAFDENMEKGVFYVFDLTERKQAEAELCKRETLLRQVLESTLDAVFAIDKDYFLLINNQKHQNLLIESGGRVLEIGDNVLSPDYPSAVLQYWKQAYDQVFAGEQLIMETHWTDLYGCHRIYENSLSPLRDAGKSIIGALVVSHDITDRKRAKAALEENELKYRRLFETGSDAMFLIDGETQRFIDVNSLAVRLYGYSKDELLSMTVFDLTADKKKTFDNIEKMAAQSTLWNRKKDGTVFPVDITTSSFELAGKSVCLSAVRDITTRHLAEKEINEKTEHLNEVNAALRALLRQREVDRQDFEETVVNNIKLMVVPYIESLRKTSLTVNQKNWIEALEENLNKVTSSFTKKITLRELNLSNAELRVANLVRDGKSSKEIAEILMTSEKTISSHRDSIRKKLGLRGKKGGLRYLLMSLE